MIRVVKKDGRVAVDGRQKLPGRGAYVHADAECVEAAWRRGGLSRTLKSAVAVEVVEALRVELATDQRKQGSR